ncbi:MAG: TPT-domain-containing protein [Amphiamblys sp. WSBS2006]|nr:MAG: TPT-domain-containing protein [Amphiamblys sp. WSBS2006]
MLVERTLIAYFISSVLLTLHCKWFLHTGRLGLPWLLFALHSVSCTCFSGCVLLKAKKPLAKPLFNAATDTNFLLYTAVYTLTIAFSNISLKESTLSFNQLARASTPLAVMAFEFLFLGTPQNLLKTASLFPIVVGIALTSIGELKLKDASAFSLVVTFASIGLSAAKGVFTKHLFVTKKENNPLVVLFNMSVLATAQSMLAALVVGELPQLRTILKQKTGAERLLFSANVLLSGVLAFGVSLSGMAGNKNTSPLSITIVGCLKQVLLIVLGMLFTECSSLRLAGACASIGGIFLYNAACYREKNKKAQKGEYRQV